VTHDAATYFTVAVFYESETAGVYALQVEWAFPAAGTPRHARSWAWTGRSR